MNCNRIQKRLSPYLDNEVSERERLAIEAHLKECARCDAEKKELMELIYSLQSLPDMVPVQDAESIFWKKVGKTGKKGLMERFRSLIGEWDFIPLRYPATAVLLLGLIAGIVFSSVYPTGVSPDRMKPAAVTYLALNRMDTIPSNSITGTYLSMVSIHHHTDGDVL